MPSAGQQMPSESFVEKMARFGPVTSKSVLDKTISLLSTSAVTRHRISAATNTLTGMEIEDQGGTANASSDPEKRIFPESYMSSISSGSEKSFIIGAMALSVFQDSGWYQVNNLNQAGLLVSVSRSRISVRAPMSTPTASAPTPTTSYGIILQFPLFLLVTIGSRHY